MSANRHVFAQAAFKEIVDKFTPSNWKLLCLSNLDKPAIPTESEPAGF
jgi:hypothetical protein